MNLLSKCGYLVLLLALCCCTTVSNYPHHHHHQNQHNDPELIAVEEIIHYNTGSGSGVGTKPLHNDDQQQHNSISTSVECAEDASTDAANDDLILVGHQRAAAKQPTEAYHQIYMLTSGEEHEDPLRAANVQFSSEQQQQHYSGDGELSEIELRHDNDKTPPQQNHQRLAPSIDMSDFVALMPAAEVRAIAVNYYRNDAEVRRAYAFLSGPDFAMLRQHVIGVPEMAEFLRYLNNSGFDVLQLVNTLAKRTAVTANETAAVSTEAVIENGQPIDGVSAPMANSHGPTASITTEPTFSTTATTTTTSINKVVPTTPTAAYAAEQLNGLHGLVDSILETLPQDQILATFFDKLETDERFAKLVNSIGSAEFAQILAKMQNSLPLRNLIFVMHNNGIYITRIVDSLKAYFFLGTF